MPYASEISTNEATVCIPWRAAPDRMAAHARVLSFWKHHGFKVVQCNSNPKQAFSLPEARNNAVKKARSEVVIVADADTIPDIAAVRSALADPVGVCWPFDRYRHIPGTWAEHPDLLAAPVDREYGASLGGLFICRRELYWKLGGMDERFERCWGYEDNAFATVAGTLSSVRRISGLVFSFNHVAERDMSVGNPNRDRFALYRFANGNVRLMQELLKR